MKPSKVGRLLASDAGLQPVIAKARRVGELSKLCFDFLPSGLARLVRAISFNERPGDRQLVLMADSPAAAAKLKLLSEALRKNLSERGAEVNSVYVRVQPGRAGSASGAGVDSRPPPKLSGSALAELQALHRKLPDSEAKSALQRLLDHQLRR